MLVSKSSFASAISCLVDAGKHTGEPTSQLTSACGVIAPGGPARMAGVSFSLCALYSIACFCLRQEPLKPFKKLISEANLK